MFSRLFKLGRSLVLFAAVAAMMSVLLVSGRQFPPSAWADSKKCYLDKKLTYPCSSKNNTYCAKPCNSDCDISMEKRFTDHHAYIQVEGGKMGEGFEPFPCFNQATCIDAAYPYTPCVDFAPPYGFFMCDFTEYTPTQNCFQCEAGTPTLMPVWSVKVKDCDEG